MYKQISDKLKANIFESVLDCEKNVNYSNLHNISEKNG